MLRYDISVKSSFVGSEDLFANRISVSSGTLWAEELGIPGYEVDARVALGDWAGATREQQAELAVANEVCSHNCVSVVRIESQQLRDVRSLIAPLRSEAQRAEARRELNCYALSITAALPDVAGWCMVNAPINVGIAEDPGGSLNTTLNRDNGLRVGLHLDSFDRLSAEERWRGSNRLCLNLGGAERALQFVPIAASRMMRLLAEKNVASAESWPRRHGRRLDLARSFLATYPDAVVVKLGLQPGEGYIAPTENMVHDGASTDRLSPDLTMTIRGYFAPCVKRLQPEGEPHGAGMGSNR